MRISIIFFYLFALLAPVLTGQDDTYYYGANYEPLENSDGAVFCKEVTHKGEKVHIIKTFFKEGEEWENAERLKVKELSPGHQLIKKRNGLLFSERIQRFYKFQEGKYHFREFKDEKLLRKGFAEKLIPLKLEGKLTTYYPGGSKKSVSFYRNNQLVRNKNWLKDGTSYIDNIFYSVDSAPSYDLGFEFFRNHILSGLFQSNYNISSVEEEIVLGWVIMENGELHGVHRVEGELVKLSELLIELVETLPGGWTPAKLNGEYVRYYMTIPFNFQQNFGQFDTIELKDGYLIWD